MPVDRGATGDTRQRRTFQRITEGLYTFGDGLAFDQDSQTLSIDIATDAGLEFIAGELAVEVGNGLELTSSGVQIDLLTSGGLEFTGSELNVADTFDLSVVGNGGLFTFSGSSVGNGIISGVARLGNNTTTATTASLSHSSHASTPAISQSTSGDVRVVSASGQVIRITPSGTAGVWVGAGSKDLTPAGLGSVIVGGTDTTGNMTATGQSCLAVGVALTAAAINSTGTFFSFALGAALSSAVISSSNFASLAYGLASGSGNTITASGFASVAGGVAGLGFATTILVSGNASFAWGAGITITGIAAQAFGEGHNVSGRNGFAQGSSHTVAGAQAMAVGFEASGRLKAMLAHSGSNHSANGDAQGGLVSAIARTTDATPTNMTIDGSSRITVQAESTIAFTAHITAKEEAAGGERAAYKVEGCIYRDATAASTTVAGVTTTTLHETTGTMDATATADTTNGALNIQVTGVAASNIRWHAEILWSEVLGTA